MKDEDFFKTDYFYRMQAVTTLIAHEIRNPLVLAQMSLEYIVSYDIEKKYEKFCRLIKKSLQNAMEIVGMYEDIWRPESAMEKINAHKLISDIVEQYEIINSNIKFDIVCLDKDFCFISNLKKLRIVITNVIKNAVESIGDINEGNIEIHFIKEAKQNIFICMDSGPGLSLDVLDKLNKEIYLTTKEYGHGLGLSIANQIMADLGGSFRLTNNPNNRGCIITMTIPTDVDHPM